MQVTLNEKTEYQGGRLCFLLMFHEAEDDELVALERTAGSTCKHGSKVLHGVTSLTSGTRKSLFVVDETNGLGEKGVVDASCSDVTLFFQARHNPALAAANLEADRARQEAKEAKRRAQIQNASSRQGIITLTAAEVDRARSDCGSTGGRSF